MQTSKSRFKLQIDMWTSLKIMCQSVGHIKITHDKSYLECTRGRFTNSINSFVIMRSQFSRSLVLADHMTLFIIRFLLV